MALTTIDLHGQVLEPVTNTPAVGTVTFKILQDLRDTVDNVVYAPQTFTATLDLNGEFQITLPVTDNADITPLNWTYWVYVDTDVWNPGVFYIALPEALGPVAEFADILPIFDESCTPDGTACAPISLVGQVDALDASVEALNDLVTDQAIEIDDLDSRLDTVEITMGALVATVNIHTGQIQTLTTNLANIDGSWITTGTIPIGRFAGTVPENQTVVLYDRPTLVTPGTAADSWQWLYNGNRTVYGNEYNLLRVRGVPDDQVVARFMSNFARDGLSTAILQASLSDALTHLFQVLGNGDILAAGGLSMLPTAYQPVLFTGAAASAALISDGASTGAPYTLGTTLHAAANRVYMDGAVVNSGGVSIPGGTVLFTIAAAHRPTAWVQFNERTSTTLSARVTIRPDGTVRLDQALAAGATCSFDGLNWRKN